MDRAIAREQSLSRLLMTYIVTGLIFMLLPGTFLGVWNLIKISSREAAESVSPAWIQAHGHAQLFGWVGTFIQGIGFSPAFPHLFDQRYLIVSTWGFIVPMVWGFSARWLPVFMGLRPLRNSFLLLSLAFNILGVVLGFLEHFFAAGIFLLVGAATAIGAIRFFEPAAKPAKTVNVHRSFPVFIRIAYGWLLIAAALSIWAALVGAAPGIWGASRHALTVGFIAAMIFCVGQRILPSFCGMRVLWSPRLMVAMLVLLMSGCTLRVASEILAYQEYATCAWNVLPVSALIELTAVALFALNLIVTFARPPVVVASPLTMTTE